MITEDFDTVYDGDLDDGNWVVADLEFTSHGAVSSLMQERNASLFVFYQQARPELCTDLPRTVLERLHSLSEDLIAATALEITENLKRSEAQRNAHLEHMGRSRERLLT